ncbi:MAG: glycosyltransferase family 4 protein [Desulfobulbus sp.]|nr:glycosyltransferase family 4 protein [Desulfobulbus sp.]
MAKRILIVARWPLGGIRTYMRYMFLPFAKKYNFTLVAASTHEDEALEKDAEEYGADLCIVHASSIGIFTLKICRELHREKYDLVLSQGFISAFAAYVANIFFDLPHILTVHGIVESKYLTGHFCYFKRRALLAVLSRVTVLYAVSNDILTHLYEQFPVLEQNGPRAIVIPNGIKLPEIMQTPPGDLANLRARICADESMFLYGFFGRFMPQKGFDLLIQAVHDLLQLEQDRHFAVVAVGSGDYFLEYQAQIKRMGLEAYFHFLPFQPQVHHLFTQVDAIIMPSRWEASGLLAMEALCMGTVLISSDCLGLRETVSDTPAVVFMSEDVDSLVDRMGACLHNNPVEIFRDFIPIARERYNVASSAKKLIQFIEGMQESE